MDHSALEAMAMSEIAAQTPHHQQSEDGALKNHLKQNSILSLTLDEIQYKSGKNFVGMSMDEFLANIWTVEDNQIQSNQNENEPRDPPFMANSRAALSRQGSFSIPIPLCGKTVEEIWSEIHKEQQHERKMMNLQQNQQAFGEMTLEDFLVKAGVVQDSPSSSVALMKEDSSSFERNRFGDLRFGIGDKLGLSLAYQQNSGRNLSSGCFAAYQMMGQAVGESSGSSGMQKCHSMTDWVAHSNKKRAIDGAPEVVVQRKQRRMIKNRESAARSRARKQAYTVELEVELNQLKEENVKLKQVVAESENKRRREVLQKKQPLKRQKPTEKLRRLRRTASMCW